MKYVLLKSVSAIALGISLTFGAMAADLPQQEDSYKPPVELYSPVVPTKHKPRVQEYPYSDSAPTVYQPRVVQPLGYSVYGRPVLYPVPVRPFFRAPIGQLTYPYFVPRGTVFGRFGHMRGRVMPMLWSAPYGQYAPYWQVRQPQPQQSESLK